MITKVAIERSLRPKFPSPASKSPRSHPLFRSSPTIHLRSSFRPQSTKRKILRRDPKSLAPLYRGFHYIKREAANTESPITPHRVPVFGAKDGLISCRLVRNQINAAADVGEKLLAAEVAALDLLDSLAQDPAIHLDMDLQVGDMQLCNNYTVLHSRTAFEDYPEPERRRHMIRLWLTMRNRRPMGEGFVQQNGYGGIAEIGFGGARP